MTTDITPEAAERARFEAWAGREGHMLRRNSVNANLYSDCFTQEAWRAWNAALATPPAQGVEPGVFVVDAAIQDVSDEAVSLTAKRLRESGLPNVAQIMLTLSALLNGARTALATPPWEEQAARQCEAWADALMDKSVYENSSFYRSQLHVGATRLRTYAADFRALLSKPAKGDTTNAD